MQLYIQEVVLTFEKSIGFDMNALLQPGKPYFREITGSGKPISLDFSIFASPIGSFEYESD